MIKLLRAMWKEATMIKAIGLLAISTVLFASEDTWAVPTQWKVSDGGNGHYYEVIVKPERITWEQARTIAENRGGYLATLTSVSEDAFVYSLAAPEVVPAAWISVYGPWLGGFQRAGSPEPDGGWQWVNGEGDFSYTNWEPGAPNDGGDGPDGAKESYLYFTNEFAIATWDDFFDDGTLSSLVVESISPVPEPSAYSLMLFGLGVLGFVIRRRK